MLVKTTINYSPNFSTYRRTSKTIKYLIYHYTGMKSETKAINRLVDVKSKVSCHYFIKKNGSIILMVPEEYEAWHAGVSNWKKDKSLNKSSIGIEISNKGHQFGYHPFNKKQIKSVINLSKYLIKKYKIKNTNILGHSDVSVKRKKDPGEKFPWEILANKKIGIWHMTNQNFLKKIRLRKVSKHEESEFYKTLFKIGYFPEAKSKFDKKMIINSFQRHFRQKLVNGKIDQECLFIAKKLVK
tara:strand:- start:129 stop:851 length:723 start_codon:yes stop_codon:yes gene_type:complete